MAEAEKTAVVVYKKEDFLKTSAPYEAVYKFREDKFKHSVELEAMAELAKTAGIKNFKTLYKNYASSLAQKDPTYIENASNFEGQELELNTGQWVADDQCISRETVYGEQIACMHPIMITQRVTNIDTGIEKVKIAYKRGYIWKSAIVDKKAISGANTIVALADLGISVTSENAKGLVQYLNDIDNLNYDIIPVKNSVGRLGWIEGEGFSPYAGELVFDGNANYKHFFEAVTQKGDYEKWLTIMRHIRKFGNTSVKIALAAAFASILVAPCNALPFFVHLWGGTGNGKTVALMVACSVWANPEKGKYWHTFDGTNVGHEQSASFVNNMPLLIDELQIQKDKKDFDALIYRLAEGIGRVRGQKTGGIQKVPTWANCIITTGEQPMTTNLSNGGAMNRIIEINCEDEKLFEDDEINNVLECVIQNYGHAGKHFVETISKPEIYDEARELQKYIQKDFIKTDTTGKQALSASIIMAAEILTEKYIFKDNAGFNYAALLKHLSSQEEVDQNNRSFEWLMNWVAQNRNKFTESGFVAESWGKLDSGKIYILNSVFERACTQEGISPAVFKGWMRRKNLLDAPKGRFTQLMRINGIVNSCVVIFLPN